MTNLARAATRDAVLHVIGTTTGYCHGVTVPADRIAADVRALLIRHYRRTEVLPMRAFFKMVNSVQVDWDVAQIDQVLMDLSLDGITDFSACLNGDCALTRAGIAVALEVRPQFEQRNVTVEWFNRFLTPEHYAELVRHITRKAKHSRDASEIREFVHDYIANTGFRDGLRNRILSGNEPTIGSMRAWVWRQALSTFRNEGTDAQMRTMKGSKTELEQRGNVPKDVFFAPAGGSIGIVYEPSEDGNTDTIHIVDNGPSIDDLVEHQAAMQRGLARLEGAVRQCKPGAADRYARILGHVAAGLGAAEVAAVEGVSNARAATLIAEVRSAGRERARLDHVRVQVLRYVKAEPMATISDLTTDLVADRTAIQSVVSELLKEGILNHHRGGSLEISALGNSIV